MAEQPETPAQYSQGTVPVWMYSRSLRVQARLESGSPLRRRLYVLSRYAIALLVTGCATVVLSHYVSFLRPAWGYLTMLVSVTSALFVVQWWGTEILPIGIRRRGENGGLDGPRRRRRVGQDRSRRNR